MALLPLSSGMERLGVLYILVSLAGSLLEQESQHFSVIREDCTDLPCNNYTLLLSVCQDCIDFIF